MKGVASFLLHSFNGEGEMSKILIVDKDKQISEGIIKSLGVDKHEFLLGTDGMVAMKSCKEEKPDLLIIEDQLPVISGMAVLRYLKGQEDMKRIPVIVITSSGSRTGKLEAIEQGAEDYLEKPYDEPYLKTRILSVLKRKEEEDKQTSTEQATLMVEKLKHKINNPLAGIIATTQLLQLQVDSEELLTRLASIEELAFKISNILKDLDLVAGSKRTPSLDQLLSQ
jgi:two-component system, OmpR family, phosphate regulon response regulator PhoB